MGIPYEIGAPGQAMPGYLWCTDAYTGEVLWKWDETAIGLSPATPSPMIAYDIDNNNIILGSYAGTMYCLNADTGATVWYREDMGAMGGQLNGPILADGIVYCGGLGWRQYGAATSYGLDALTGETIWSVQTPGAQKHQGAVADGIWYVPTGDGWIYAFGSGPTKTTLDLSTAQLKAGDTILISGQVLDQSPASSGNFDAPVADEPVTIMYAPLGGLDIQTIATLTTGYAGDYYYEWTVPTNITGMHSIVASFAGSDAYEPSSATTNFRSGPSGFTPAELEQIIAAGPEAISADEVASEVIAQLTAPQDYTTMFYAVIALVVIAVAISVYSAFIRKQK